VWRWCASGFEPLARHRRVPTPRFERRPLWLGLPNLSVSAGQRATPFRASVEGNPSRYFGPQVRYAVSPQRSDLADYSFPPRRAHRCSLSCFLFGVAIFSSIKTLINSTHKKSHTTVPGGSAEEAPEQCSAALFISSCWLPHR